MTTAYPYTSEEIEKFRAFPHLLPGVSSELLRWLATVDAAESALATAVRRAALASPAAMVDDRERCAVACDERESMFLRLSRECREKRKFDLESVHDHRRIEARSCAAAIRALPPAVPHDAGMDEFTKAAMNYARAFWGKCADECHAHDHGVSPEVDDVVHAENLDHYRDAMREAFAALAGGRGE